MKFIAIVSMGTLAALGCGFVHDQVTARICVEALAAGRAPRIDWDELRLAALVAGALPSACMGVVQGVLLAFASRAGRRPKLGPLRLVFPMTCTLLASAATGVAGYFLGAWLAEHGIIAVADELAELVPESEHVEHLAQLWARGGSYLGSALAGLTVVARTWKRRGRMQRGARRRSEARAR